MNKIFAFVAAFIAVATLSTANHNNAALLLANVRPLQMVVTHAPTEEDVTVIVEAPAPRTGCTVFSVSPKNHGWATAAHCVIDRRTGEPRTNAFFIDGHPAIVVRVDVEHDLALFRVTDGWGVATSIKLARHAPKVGDFIETAGYAYGDARPFYFAGYISVDEFQAERIPEWFGTYAGVVAIGGQSGSPVVNEEGRLVGVLHIGFGGTGEADPITGITSFATLVAFDGGWVFDK